MSSEQISGRPVDQRCDVWALGAVLAEMLTGESPFQRDSVPAICLAILNDAPQPVERTPEPLQAVLYRALAKDPERRFASCGEFLAALERAAAELPAEEPVVDTAVTQPPGRQKRWTSAAARKAREDATKSAWGMATGVAARRRGLPTALMAALISVGALLAVSAAAVWFVPALRNRAAVLLGVAQEQKHIAVLPFDNIGSNPENQVLIDGLLESLTGRLSNLDVGNQSLWVVPDSVVRSHHVTDPSQALKELGATLVVKGAVERDGTDIQLTANLIDTRTLRQIGSVDVQDQAGNLSTLEDETVARLAQLMKLNVTAEMLRDTGGRVDPAAYQDYLTALGYMDRYDKPGNLDAAIAALNQSTETDPNFALGFAAAGEAYRLKYQVSQNSAWLTEAQANCEKAVELDNSVPATYVTLAQIHDDQGKHELALQELDHALQLDPNDAAALGGLAVSYEKSGRIADAEKAYEKAVALQPNNWAGYNSMGAFYDRQGKYPQAIAAYKQALAITPDNSEIYSNLAAAYLDQGGAQSQPLAEQALKKSIALSPNYPAWANLRMLYMQEKRYTEAAAATENALKINPSNYLVWSNLVLACDGANEEDKARAARLQTERIAENVVASNPQDAMAQSTLAVLYAHDKQNEKALAKIQTSLALAPDDPNVLANVADAWESLGDRNEALKYVEEAIGKGYALADITDDPNLQPVVADPRFRLKGK
jgi:serine/threonine-protein kinase